MNKLSLLIQADGKALGWWTDTKRLLGWRRLGCIKSRSVVLLSDLFANLDSALRR